MRGLLTRFSILAAGVGTPFVLYIPFRLLAQGYCTVTRAGSDNFAYPSATLLWPLFAFVSSFIPAFLGALLRHRVVVHVLAFIATAVAWDVTPGLDDWLGIPAGGLNGFRSYPSSYSGLSTPLLSVMISPSALLLGVPVGAVAGYVVRRTNEVRRPGFPIGPTAEVVRGRPDESRGDAKGTSKLTDEGGVGGGDGR